MVLFGPHLDANEMHQTYSKLLNLNPKLSGRFRDMIGQTMMEILKADEIWHFLSPVSLLSDFNYKGLLIYDHDDEEIPLEQFKAVDKNWHACRTIETQGPGHHRILKDKKIIESVLTFMKQQ